MNSALEQFDSNIERTRILVAIHSGLVSQTSSALDISDVLRSALVLAVSALDQYVHELVRLGVLEIYNGTRPSTAQWQKLQVSLGGAIQMRQAPVDDRWLDNQIRERHGWQSFEQPEKIADAIRLISDVRLWDLVAADLRADVSDVKRRLALIVDRRNKIAHEADLDPTFPGTRWRIDEQMVSDSIAFIERIVGSVHKAVSGVP